MGIGTISISDYACRRFFRIAPLSTTWPLLFIPFFHVFTGQLSRPERFLDESVVWNFFFLHGLEHTRFMNTAVPGGWTVGDEMLFYAVFPLVASTIKGIKGAASLFLTSSVFAAIADLLFEPMATRMIETHSWDSHLAYYWLPNQLPVFFAGVVAYHAIVRLQPKYCGRTKGKAISLVLLGSAGFLFYINRVAPEYIGTSILGLLFASLCNGPGVKRLAVDGESHYLCTHREVELQSVFNPLGGARAGNTFSWKKRSFFLCTRHMATQA